MENNITYLMAMASLMLINNIQFLANIANVLSMLFIPLFAETLGASYLEIGVIVGIFSAATLLSSFIFGRAADLYRLRSVLLFGFGVSCVTFFLQVFAQDPFSLLVARAFAGFSVGIYPGALIAYVHYRQQSIGKFISLGSLGWMAGFILAGFLGDLNLLFLLSSFLYLLCFVQAIKLKDLEKPGISLSYFSFDTLFRNADTYLSLLIRHTGAVAVWTIFPLYLQRLGANDFWIGIVYSVNSAVQFLVMRRLDGFENNKLILAGCLLSIFGFLSYLLAPSYPYLIPGMVIIACSWSFLYVGSTRRVVERNPDKASAAGLISSIVGASGVFGALLGGFLSQSFGFEATMLAAAFLSLAGFFVFKILDRDT